MSATAMTVDNSEPSFGARILALMSHHSPKTDITLNQLTCPLEPSEPSLAAPEPEGADMSDAAVSLFKKTEAAAEEGNIEAQYNLGCYYRLGFGVKKDYEAAADWFYVAASTGDVSAQYNMGNCYRFGVGVECSTMKARLWYERAATQGHENAKLSLKQLDADRKVAAATLLQASTLQIEALIARYEAGEKDCEHEAGEKDCEDEDCEDDDSECGMPCPHSDNLASCVLCN